MDNLNNVNESTENENVSVSEATVESAGEAVVESVSESTVDSFTESAIENYGDSENAETASGSGLNVFGLIAMILGILGLLGNICCCCGGCTNVLAVIPAFGMISGALNIICRLVFLIMGVAALVLAIIGKKQKDKAQALALVGLILGIVVIVLSGLALLVTAFSGLITLLAGVFPILGEFLNEISANLNI